MNTIQHVPKGGMCAGCEFALGDCSELDFKSMPVIQKPDENNVAVVRCSNYWKTEDKGENKVDHKKAGVDGCSCSLGLWLRSKEG
jgi:hypothetical protein